VVESVRSNILKDIRTYGVLWSLNFAFRFKVWPPLMTAYLRPDEVDGLVRLGTPYGGWWVPEAVLRPGAVAYCAGAGDDISFDIALHERGLRVITIDPTPMAIAHINAEAPRSDRFVSVPVGLWDAESELRFYAPRNPEYVSHSVMNLQRSSEYFDAAVKPLQALMNDLGDQTIDLLKLDIEGAEHRVIESFLASGIRPRVVCAEFDQPAPLRTVLQSIRRLQQSGYRLVKIDQWNYTFVAVDEQAEKS
jgi:FkbM family methyltransferase